MAMGPRADLATYDAVFDALAHEVRRHIVMLLAHHGPELPSGYLATRFAHSWPTTTRHLRVLVDAGLLRHERSGRNHMYAVDQVRLELLKEWLGWFDRPPG